MKRIFAIVLILCMMIMPLCVTTFAATSADDVIRVGGIKEDGTVIIIDGYTDFESGWNAAMTYAGDRDYLDDNGYVRVVVDMLADWTSNDKGEFGQGEGFQWRTIYFPKKVRVVLNMNGYTIDRDLAKYELDGEVMFIDEGADVVINGGKDGDPIIKKDENSGNVEMGTITGGWSYNGTGGIHIGSGANVVLNNVNVVGNTVEDGNGAAIAVHKGATLTMNGGRISDNILYDKAPHFALSNGSLYVAESTATLNGVIISGNKMKSVSGHGAAIYINDGRVDMNDCLVFDNGVADSAKSFVPAISVVGAENGGQLYVEKTEFYNNGTDGELKSGNGPLGVSILIYMNDGYLSFKDSKIHNNDTRDLIYLNNSDADLNNSAITDNRSRVIYADDDTGNGRYLSAINCVFNNNASVSSPKLADIYVSNRVEWAPESCDLGDTTIDKSYYKGPGDFSLYGSSFASIIGEGSLTMLVSLISLAVSVAAIGISVTANKKKKSEEEDE